MLEFFIVASLMTLAAIIFILLPALQSQRQPDHARSQINIDLFKNRLAELEKEKEAELLSEQEFNRLKLDLERRLLNEVNLRAEQQSVKAASSVKISTVLMIALLIPLLAGLLYSQTGAMPDLQISETLKRLQQQTDASQDTAAMMSALNDQLSSRLEQKPEDINYLMLLGRLAIEQGNYAGAAATFGRLTAIAGDDPVVLAQYTQALFLAADRRLTPEAKAIAERALSIDPMQPTVLGLLGMNSYEQGDFVSAVAYWQRLLSIMNPTSPQAQMIQQVLQQAQANLPEATASQTGESALISLTVEVSLAEGLQAPADAQVFVFARALQGPPMPLAVARLTVADLPAVIELNDSMAMMPSMKLSSFQQVELVARISSRGIADPTAGDIEGVQSPIDTRRSKPVTLQINQLLK